MTIDPPRWLDEMPEDVSDAHQRALRMHARLAPNPERYARTWQGVSNAIDISTGGGAGLDRMHPSAHARAWFGVMIIGVSAVISALVLLSDHERDGALPQPPALETSAPAVPSSPTPETRASTEIQPPMAAPASPEKLHANPAPTAPPRAARRDPRNRPPSTQPGSSPEVPEASPSLDPKAELELLTRARRTLLSSPGRAIELTDEHARVFPHGMFEQEREMIAIDALLRAGRGAAARARAAQFLAAHPQSAHAERLHAIIAAE